MRRLVFLLQVSRPILWPVLPMVYYLGVHSAGAHLSAVAVIQMVLLTFPMNFVGCALNDIYDVDSDRLSRRRKLVWGAELTEADAALLSYACWVMGAVFVLGALVTRNTWNIGAACAMIVAAKWYSVPPVRLKERPPLDSLANGFGYFLLPFAMGYSLGADPRAMPLKYWLLVLAVCGIHALATAADYDADRAAGHRTFAVAFGKRAAGAFAAGTFLIALCLGGYRSMAVDVFLVVGALASVVAAIAPGDRVIAAACTAIFVGFVVAASGHVMGW